METGKIEINLSQLYYERSGHGIPLIFVHGAFADMHIFDPQWDYFLDKFPILRYDLRGHAKTGPSELRTYKMETFIDDLAGLMDALEIPSGIICGLSWGGSIAQGFASRHPERTIAIITASSMVSMSLTLNEKIQQYILIPHWLMRLIIQSMQVSKFVEFSLWLAEMFFGKGWLSGDEKVTEYLKQSMRQVESEEYLKLWDAMYGFRVFDLEKITCPTLVLNGENEPRKMYHHTDEIIKLVPTAQAKVIPNARHAMNLENPIEFNRTLEEFINQLNKYSI